MGGFNKFDKGRNGKSFGGGGFGGPRRFEGRSDIPRQMHPATCSQCGQACEIPFKPTGERPVFCRNCFKGQAAPGQGGGNQRFAPKSLAGGHFGHNTGGNASSSGTTVSKAQFDSLNAKLDKILSLLTATPEDKAEDKAMALAEPAIMNLKKDIKTASKPKTTAKKSKAKKK